MTTEAVCDIAMRAEQCLLSCLILSEDARAEALSLVECAWLQDARHVAIVQALRAIESKQKTADPSMVAAVLAEQGQWGTLVTSTDMSRLLGRYAIPGNVHVYLAQVKDFATLMACEKAGQEITAAARSGMPTDKLLQLAVDKVDALTEQADSGETIDFQRSMGETLEVIRERMRSPGGDIMATAGIDSLDRGTHGGLRANQLTILAARPSVGKSSLACQYATASAEKGPVLFVTLEMTSQELTERILVQKARVDFGRLRDGTQSPQDLECLVHAASELAGLTMEVMDASRVTVQDVIAKARAIKRRRGGLSLVVIDYLQLLSPDDRRAPREQQVAGMTRDLKNGAKALKCPILCLAQMNRELEKLNRAPRLSDLRESGAIEQDADNVLLMWRPDDREREKVEVIIAKQRNGPAGKCELRWSGRNVVFAEQERPTGFAELSTWNDMPEDGFDEEGGEQ